MPRSEVKKQKQKTDEINQTNNDINTNDKNEDINDANLSDSSSDVEFSWQYVPIRTLKRANSQSPPMNKPKRFQQETAPSTTNKFAVLSSSNNENSNKAASPQEDQEPQQPKPPPIFIPDVGDIAKMVNKCSKIIERKEFYYKSNSDGQIRLNVKTVDSYRKITKYFDDNNILYHTYQLKQERAFTVVIKGLHHTTPIEDIKANFVLLGHVVRGVRNIRSRITKNPLPMFFVDFEPKPNNHEIYNIKAIGNAIVVIEAPKKFNDIVQCFRCQQFGHTKSYCRKRYSCVKCGLEHPTKECTKSLSTPPKCVHCLESHTANYKGCIVYQKLVTKRKNTSERNPINVNNKFNNQISPVTQNSGQVTYAQALRSTNDDLNNVLQKIESMLEKQIELTNTLMNMMSMLMTKLCK